MIVIKVPNTKTVALAVGVKIGSIYEPEERRGISHFLEHMMFKSNYKYSAEEINRIVEFSGGIFNAFTSRDMTVYFFEVLKENFEKVFDVFYSMFTNKEYRENEFEKEKLVVLSEIEMYENDPTRRIYDLGPLALFGKSDLGDPIAGYRETVQSITKKTGRI